MTQPWNLKEDSTRTSDSLVNFIVFCEDGEIEPEYFSSLGTSKVKISPIRNSGQQHKQVDFATEHCKGCDLIEVVEGKEKLKVDDGTQVWCVFDRDKEVGDMKDTSFTDSIEMAELKGMRTAWSNDDFELWILLHFEEVNPQDDTYFHRTKYYERLTQYFKSCTPKSKDEEVLFSHARFDYYSSMKRKKRFLSITLQHMRGLTSDAIKRAKALADFHSTPPKPHYQKCPCTMVYLLVEEIAKYS